MSARKRGGTKTPSTLTIRLIALLIVSLLAVQTGVFLWSVHMRSQEQLMLIASDRARLAITLYQILDRLSASEKALAVNTLAYRNFTLSLIPGGDEPSFSQKDSQESLLLRHRLRELCLASTTLSHFTAKPPFPSPTAPGWRLTIQQFPMFPTTSLVCSWSWESSLHCRSF